ncbi:GTP cyclohydrolase I FolE [Candidatus Gracilibacteria bacterium]|nr:GTP cyclohydrolase I FolE [Candidatus Gracilibacteria bacterium]MCF7819028.1 GTP cyclohydrolase I FolE [Candidatus Gracilibacteria bacterium]
MSAQSMNIQDHIREILKLIGEDPERDDLIETPQRIADSYKELFSGYKEDPRKVIKTFEANGYEEMILVKNIDYFSTCEHHMIPFFGMAHIAYIPDKKITGLSKLPRIVDIFARRLQNQERLTVQVADVLHEELNPKGVAVQVSGRHLCMCGRGVKKVDAETVTTAFRGAFKTKPDLKNDFFNQIKTS